MIMEYLENIVQLLCILSSLLISLFRYISSKKRCWLYSVAFFTGSLLSCYFWTAYLVIMRASPNASDTLTYFGWNVSYIVMLILTIHVKTREERRYFHPLMLLPIPLSAWQLKLYLSFSGAVNSIYQVTICTITACLCIQELMWYIKNRKNTSKRPFTAAAVLLCVCSEFGMWTSSCFDGWTLVTYYICSFLCSLSYLLIVRSLRKSGRDETENVPVFSDTRMQNILKGTYLSIVTVCSAGGILLGIWIRDVLAKAAEDASHEGVYNIIHVILFLTSIILAAFAIAIVLIVYFEQKIFENNRLREEKLVAERSNAAKSEFLANMSHEIRTPINAVLGMNKMIMLESLRAKDTLPRDTDTIRDIFSDITDHSYNIESAGNSLLSIINDILDFSKIEAGKLDITEREYSLGSVLGDVSNTVMFKARDKGLDFHVETDPDIPDELYGDDMRIRQIIINLLNNAVKYTDKGSVTLSVHGSGSYTEGGMTVLDISVADTGIGIKQEDIDRIFDKFERTDLKHNSTVEGTGLGLAITSRLTNMMKGSITVESEYGKGSVFTLHLPQEVISADSIGDLHPRFEKSFEELYSSENILRAPDAHILIVDDTRMNLSVAEGLLRDTEIKIDTAVSGELALDMARSGQYDLILMDQRMPVMDGTETLKRLRQQEKEQGKDIPTPVICLTADALSGAKERYIAEGFDDYLSKPIDSRAMKKMIMRYLPRKKLLPVRDPADTEDQAAPAAEDDLFVRLNEAGIDTAAGLGYFQDEREFYLDMLSEYARSASEKLESMQGYLDEQDIKNYGIVVHSLKSTSRTIGAEEIAGLAAEAEKAAKAEDTNEVSRLHPDLAERFKAVTEAISAAL